MPQTHASDSCLRLMPPNYDASPPAGEHPGGGHEQRCARCGPGVHVLCAGPVLQRRRAALHPHRARRGECAGGPPPCPSRGGVHGK
eukprot:7777145-Pyramimonas_sp.AAC.1